MEDAPGLSFWAELKASLGDLTKSVQERNRQAAKAAEQPVFARFQGAAIAAGGIAVITTSLGSPSQGYTWNVRNLAVGGLTPTTAAVGRADVYATASDMRTPFLAGNLGLTDWRDQMTALPAVQKYGEGELFLRSPEELIVVISGATNGQQYVIAGTIQQVQESAKQQAWTV